MAYEKIQKSLEAIANMLRFIQEEPQHECLARVSPLACPGIEALIKNRILSEKKGEFLIRLLREDLGKLEIKKQIMLIELEKDGFVFLEFMSSDNNTQNQKMAAFILMMTAAMSVLQEFGLDEAKHEALPPEYQAQPPGSEFVEAEPPQGASPEAKPPGEASQAVQGSPPKYEPPPPPQYQVASPQSEQASQVNQPQNEPPPPYQAPAPAPSQSVQAQPVQASPQNEPPEETGDEDEQHGQGGSRPC